MVALEAHNDAWTDADEAAWHALHQAQYGVEPLADFIGRVNPKYPTPEYLAPLLDVLERARHGSVFAIVSMPPRHRKSTTCENAIARMFDLDPSLSHGYITYNQKKARTESRRMQLITQRAGVALDPKRRNLDEWGVLLPDGTPGGTLWAAGWGGGLNGVGITGVLMLDDLVKNAKEVSSRQFREDQWEWFMRVAMTRLEPGASCIILMTRWDEDDVPGRLLKFDPSEFADLADELKIPIPEWEYINLPAICVDERDGTGRKLGDALWPEAYPIGRLRYMQKLDPEGFEALYQGNPTPPGGRLFGTADPMRYNPDDLLAVGAEGARMVISVDPASTENDKSCPWAATLLWGRGYGPEMDVWLVDLMHDKFDPITGAEQLLEFQRKWGVPVVIEGNGPGKAVIAALRRLAPELVIIEVTADRSKWIRAQPVASAWRRNKVRVPLNVPWAARVIRQAKDFVGEGSPETDIIDAMAHGYNYLVDGGEMYQGYGETTSHMPLW